MGLITSLIAEHQRKEKNDFDSKMGLLTTMLSTPGLKPEAQTALWQNVAVLAGTKLGLPKQHHGMLGQLLAGMSQINPAPKDNTGQGMVPMPDGNLPGTKNTETGAGGQPLPSAPKWQEPNYSPVYTTEQRREIADNQVRQDAATRRDIGVQDAASKRDIELNYDAAKLAEVNKWLDGAPNLPEADRLAYQSQALGLKQETSTARSLASLQHVTVTPPKGSKRPPYEAAWNPKLNSYVDYDNNPLEVEEGSTVTPVQAGGGSRADNTTLGQLKAANAILSDPNSTPEQRLAAKAYLHNYSLGMRGKELGNTGKGLSNQDKGLVIRADTVNLGLDDPGAIDTSTPGGIGNGTTSTAPAPKKPATSTAPATSAAPATGTTSTAPAPAAPAAPATTDPKTSAKAPPPAPKLTPEQEFYSYNVDSKTWSPDPKAVAAQQKALEANTASADVTQSLPTPKLKVAAFLGSPKLVATLSRVAEYTKDVLLGNVPQGGRDRFGQAQFKIGLRALHDALGISPEQLSSSLKDRAGVADALKNNAERYAAFTRIDNELANMGVLLQQARGRVPDYNTFINRVANHIKNNFTGDKATKELVIAANGFSRVYATLVGGGWTSNAMPHVESADQANEAIAASMTKGQFDGLVIQVHRDAVAVRKSLIDTSTSLMDQLAAPLGGERKQLADQAKQKDAEGSSSLPKPVQKGQMISEEDALAYYRAFGSDPKKAAAAAEKDGWKIHKAGK